MLQALILTLVTNPVGQMAQQPRPGDNPDRIHQLKDLERAKVTIGEKHKFNLWIMDTEMKRMEGMMFVQNRDFKDDEGMIFVFAKSEPQRFWMKNTYVDLDIAYIGEDKRINSVYTMRAFDTTTDYSSAAPSKWVIEVRSGTFKTLGIRPGMKVEIPETVKSKD